ncbi:MAG: hypothetical protein B6D55_05735 [Candidatus Omnitrophica bacterium 4484_70.2]|nr:MAG: hypothetical protein B6D55_05735 [Candidatus Omnitrophica bacterium 4484_70.2]
MRRARLPFLRKKLKVEDLMTCDVATVTPDTTLKEAAEKMAYYRVGNVLVVHNNRLEGIVTDTDLTRKAIAKGKGPNTKVKEIMTSPVKFVSPEDDVFHVSDKLLMNKITRLPVIDVKNKKLLGIITTKDILRVVPDFLLNKIEWLRVHPGGKAKRGKNIKGICEVCGKKSNDLRFSKGLWVCEEHE